MTAVLNPPDPGGDKTLQAGYSFSPNVPLLPPSLTTGFREFTANIRLAGTGLSAGRVQFTFQFADGKPVVITKRFDQMSPRPSNSQTKIISANSLEFGGLDVKTANLTKVLVYVESNKQQVLYLGKCTVSSGQGTFEANTLLAPDAGCTVTDTTPKGNN
ncbi:MAG: hypothetical protein K2Z81_05475 [Cyanobacteria bacterium]|nr:hypothetical protein [Cyanobacteriota bacterium]